MDKKEKWDIPLSVKRKLGTTNMFFIGLEVSIRKPCARVKVAECPYLFLLP